VGRNLTEKKTFGGLIAFIALTATVALVILLKAPKGVIAIIPGHWGSDPGAVCPDGLEERDVNLKVAEALAKSLREKGYQAQLLPEFSPKAKTMKPALFLSIHADSCIEGKSGFKLVSRGEGAEKLADCLRESYYKVTGLPFDPSTITPDMEEYHLFREIDPHVPAAIVETGFLGEDRWLLEGHPEVVAKGLEEGILCFLGGEK
jgi:N-acetylmuramoyl-L-alanine amidase